MIFPVDQCPNYAQHSATELHHFRITDNRLHSREALTKAEIQKLLYISCAVLVPRERVTIKTKSRASA